MFWQDIHSLKTTFCQSTTVEVDENLTTLKLLNEFERRRTRTKYTDNEGFGDSKLTADTDNLGNISNIPRKAPLSQSQSQHFSIAILTDTPIWPEHALHCWQLAGKTNVWNGAYGSPTYIIR
jgi:hypothetical protein